MFDVTAKTAPGQRRNALAVRVSPPPHPGIPARTIDRRRPRRERRQPGASMVRPSSPPRAGIGFRGFATATPASGRSVELAATGGCALDPHVITRLPLPRTIRPTCPIIGAGRESRASAVQRHADRALRHHPRCARRSSFAPGNHERRSIPRSFRNCICRAAAVVAERLWSANLYTLSSRSAEGARIGFRHAALRRPRITYELVAVRSPGRLRRVEVDPTLGSALGRAAWSMCATKPSSARRRAGRDPDAGRRESRRCAGRKRIADAVSRHPRQRRAHRRARRQLGHGRFAQAHFARAAGALFRLHRAAI
jgi:hypothetical protein